MHHQYYVIFWGQDRHLHLTKILPLKKKSYSFHKNISSIIVSNDLLRDGDGVVVAVSGGSDSIALLCTLCALPINLRLRAVYVDHCLRPTETPLEIVEIKKLCARLQVQLTIKTVDVKQLAGNLKMSTEEAARHLRYQALKEVKQFYNFDKIAVGHHADDQVEEFFIRLFRGSGTSGLAGMSLQKGDIIRPLLFQTKKAIEEYLKSEHISWCNDSSNLTRDFLRNKIRLDLLPELEKNYNPAIRNTVLHSMNVLEVEDDLLNSICEHTYPRCAAETFHQDGDNFPHSVSLFIDKYLSQHLAVRRRVIEKICWKMRSRPSFIIISDIDQLAKEGENGKELHLQAGLRVTRKHDVICFNHPPLRGRGRGVVELPEAYEIRVDTTGSYLIPGTGMTVTFSEEGPNESQTRRHAPLRVDLEQLKFPCIIRGVRPGERFTPYSGVGSKKISRYFNDQKLEKNKRPSWPIVFDQTSVVAIVGYTIEERFKVTETTNRVLCISYSEDSSGV